LVGHGIFSNPLYAHIIWHQCSNQHCQVFAICCQVLRFSMTPSNLLAATVHKSRNLWDPNNNTSAQVPSNQYRQLSVTEQPRLKVRGYFLCKRLRQGIGTAFCCIWRGSATFFEKQPYLTKPNLSLLTYEWWMNGSRLFQMSLSVNQ
jgi:hypothetical protein